MLGVQVFTRPQMVMVCMSRKSALRILDSLGEGHDEPVEEWRDSLLIRVHDSLQVVITVL